jgi:glycosyltransferase involved in cell wall biosynthesis
MTQKRILIISPEVVFPADTGGKIRTATLAKQLSIFSKVTILYMANGNINTLESNIDQERVSLGKYFNLWSLVSLWNPLSPKLPKKVTSDIGEIRDRVNPDVVLFEHSTTTSLINSIDWGDAELVYSTHNVDSYTHAEKLRLLPYQWFPGNVWRRMLMNIRARKQDMLAVTSSDQLWVCSERDRKRYHELAGVSATLVPNPVPNDAVFGFTIKPERYAHGGIVYIGTLTYKPNLMAIDVLVNEVLPLLPKYADVKIAGRHGAHLAKELGKHAKLKLILDPPEISEVLEPAGFSILPINSGGGTRIKVLEAMAAGVVLIATAKAVEGLGLVPVKHFAQAETADAMALAYSELSNNPEVAAKMATEARAFVSKRFGADTIGNILRDLV